MQTLKITINPSELNEWDNNSIIPPHLQKIIASWSDSKYSSFSFGSILVQQFICKHYSIYFYRIAVETPVTLESFLDQPIIALQFTMAGNIRGILNEYYGVEMNAGNYALCYLPVGLHQVHLEKGITESIHFELGPSWIDDLAETNESVHALLENLKAGSKSVIILPVVSIDYLAMHNITEILTCKEYGADLLMDLKTTIGNLLNLYRKSIKEKEYLDKLPVTANQEQLINIWNKIKTNPDIHLHSVTQLCKDNFLHEKTLKRNFRKLFEAELSNFVQEQCMNKAYHLITSTKKPVEEIAIELGYREFSSFTRAFKKRFQLTPLSVRRRKTFQKMSKKEQRMSLNDK